MEKTKWMLNDIFHFSISIEYKNLQILYGRCLFKCVWSTFNMFGNRMAKKNSCNFKWAIHTRSLCLDAYLIICFPFVYLSGGANQSNDFSLFKSKIANRFFEILVRSETDAIRSGDDDVNTTQQWNKSHLCNCTFAMLFFLLYDWCKNWTVHKIALFTMAFVLPISHAFFTLLARNA